MAVGCGATLAKWILFAFNVLFWLAGILFIVVAIVIVAQVNISNYQQFLTPNDQIVRAGAWTLLAVGIFMLIVGFCGCCGAIMESVCLLGLYITFLVITMLVEAAIAIYIGVKKDDIGGRIKEAMLDVVQNVYQSNNSTRMAVDSIQQDSQCCGVNNASDWITSTYIRSTSTSNPTMSAPDSCCMDKTNYATCHASKGYYAKGCLQSAQVWFQTYYPILIGVAAGIAGLELLGILLACVLTCSIRNSKGMMV